MIEEYEQAGVNVIWLEIGDVDFEVKENATYFSERFALNEGSQTLVLVDYDLERVVEYRMDPNSYIYNGRKVFNDKELYEQEGVIEQLVYKDNVITFEDYDKNYNQWLERRKVLFQRECVEIEKNKIYEERRQEEYELRQKWLKEREKQSENILENMEDEHKKLATFLENANKIIRDSAGNRVIKCRYCGKVGNDDLFCTYGGAGSINMGICMKCGKES